MHMSRTQDMRATRSGGERLAVALAASRQVLFRARVGVGRTTGCVSKRHFITAALHQAEAFLQLGGLRSYFRNTSRLGSLALLKKILSCQLSGRRSAAHLRGPSKN
jgi:hypothetical protein